MTVFLMVLCSCLFAFAQLQAQEIAAKASAAKRDFAIGDHAEIVLEIKHPANYSLVWPKVNGQINGLEIIDTLATDSMDQAGSLIHTQKITVSAFDSGKYIFPPLTFTFRRAGSADLTINSNPLAFHFSRVTVDTTKDIKPIKDPLSAPITLEELIPYILGGLMVLVIGLIVWNFWRNRRRRPAPAPVRPPMPAWQRALEELEKLRPRLAEADAEPKPFYIDLSTVVREYLSAVYRFDAMELTTAQTLERLRPELGNKEVYPQVRELLQLADMVKFAKYRPAGELNANALDTAVQIVENTKPKPASSQGLPTAQKG